MLKRARALLATLGTLVVAGLSSFALLHQEGARSTEPRPAAFVGRVVAPPTVSSASRRADLGPIAREDRAGTTAPVCSTNSRPSAPPVAFARAWEGLVVGRVVDADGQPVGGARVRVAALWREPDGFALPCQLLVALGETAPDGRFTSSARTVPRDARLIFAALDTRAEACATGYARANEAPGSTVDFGTVTLQREPKVRQPARLTIHVRADGTAVEGANVDMGYGLLGTGCSDFGGESWRTDADGVIATDLCASGVRFSVSKAGYATECRYLDRVEREDTRVEVDLVHATPVAGRVLGPEGSAVENGSVTAREIGLPDDEQRSTTSASTDSSGRYVLGELAKGRTYVVVAQSGSALALPRVITPPISGELDLVLSRTGRLRVEFHRERDGRDAVTEIVGRLVERQDDVTRKWEPYDLAEDEVFGQRSMMKHLVPGLYRVICQGNGVQPSYSEPVVVSAGEIPARVTVVGKPGPLVSGRVVDSKGEPVEDANVVVELGSWRCGVHLGSYPSGHTRKDGSFWISALPFESFRLLVYKEGSTTWSEVPAGGEFTLPDLVLGYAAARR